MKHKVLWLAVFSLGILCEHHDLRAAMRPVLSTGFENTPSATAVEPTITRLSISKSPEGYPNATMVLSKTMDLEDTTDDCAWDLGTAFQSATSCDCENRAWEIKSGKNAFLQEMTLNTTAYLTATTTEWYTGASCDGPFTTLCDGITRAMCSPKVPQSWFSTKEIDSISWWKTKSAAITPFSVPPPDCKVSPQDCSELWNTFYSELTRLEWSPVFYTPHCSYQRYATCVQQCVFEAPGMQLFHWPVTMDKDALCSSKHALKHRDELPEQTRVWMGHTVVSPTMYALIPTISHAHGCGSAHTSVFVPLHSTDIKSGFLRPRSLAEDDGGSGTSYSTWYTTEYLPFSLEHLAYKTIGNLSYPLMPASVYCGNKRLDERCSTMYQDYQLSLQIAIPPKSLASIDSAWSYCSLATVDDGVFRPPVALPRAPYLFTPEQIIQFPQAANTGPIDTSPEPTPAGQSPGNAQQQISPGGMATESFPQQTIIPQHDSAPAAPRTNLPPGQSSIFVNIISQVTILAELTLMQPQGRGSAGQQKPASGVTQAAFRIKDRVYTATQISPGVYVVDGLTVSKVGSPVTLNGVRISAIGSGVVLGETAKGTRLGEATAISPLDFGTLENNNHGEGEVTLGTSGYPNARQSSLAVRNPLPWYLIPGDRNWATTSVVVAVYCILYGW